MRRGWPYGRYGKEHYGELFLAENRVLDQRIGEADEASAAFF